MVVKRKVKVQRALSDAHLRAIGMVAAQWSSLEMTLLHTLSQVAGIDYKHTLILAGAQNANEWCAMLKKISGDTKKPGPGATPTMLDRLATSVQELGPKRNGVVHASWHPRYSASTGPLSLKTEPPPKAREKARGPGLKKKGAGEVTIAVAYTSAEIREIAREIEATERAVVAWGTRWQLVRNTQSALQPSGMTLPQASDFLALRNLQAATPPSIVEMLEGRKTIPKGLLF